jgi:hypothetical protein
MFKKFLLLFAPLIACATTTRTYDHLRLNYPFDDREDSIVAENTTFVFDLDSTRNFSITQNKRTEVFTFVKQLKDVCLPDGTRETSSLYRSQKGADMVLYVSDSVALVSFTGFNKFYFLAPDTTNQSSDQVVTSSNSDVVDSSWLPPNDTSKQAFNTLSYNYIYGVDEMLEGIVFGPSSDTAVERVVNSTDFAFNVQDEKKKLKKVADHKKNGFVVKYAEISSPLHTYYKLDEGDFVYAIDDESISRSFTVHDFAKKFSSSKRLRLSYVHDGDFYQADVRLH